MCRQFHYSLSDLKLLAQSIRIHSLSPTSPITTRKWSTTTHLTSTRRFPHTPTQLHRTLPDATHTPPRHLNNSNASNFLTPTRNTPLRDLQPFTPTRPRFLQPPSLDNSREPLADTPRDTATHPRPIHYTPLPAHVQTPQSAELYHMIGHVTATSVHTTFDNTETIHTSVGANSSLGHTRSPALSLTQNDPFRGGGWGGRTHGHVPTLTTHTATHQHHAIDRHHPQLHQSRSIFDSDSIFPSTVFSPPGSDPPLSPDHSRKKRTSACNGGQSEDHFGLTHTGSTRHDPDTNDRHKSRANLGDVDREARHDVMPMEEETVQSLLSVGKETPVRASLAHNVFDLPGTHVGSSQRQLGRHRDTDAPESAVHMTGGDSGTANDSMMEVEEETSVTDLGVTRHRLDNTATRGIIDRLRDADAGDMPGCGGDTLGFGRTLLLNTTDQPSAPAIDWASLGRSEFDLPSTSVSASRSRPDTQLVINLDTLGRSDVTMPGDDTGMGMQEASAATPTRQRPRGNRRIKSANAKRKHAARQY